MRLRDLTETGKEIDLPKLHVGDAIRVDGVRKNITGQKPSTRDGQPVLKTNKGNQKVFTFDLARITPDQPKRAED